MVICFFGPFFDVAFGIASSSALMRTLACGQASRHVNPAAMPLTPKHIARACHQLLPVLETFGAETTDALAKVCDPNSVITREDARALAIALLVELQARRPRGKR